MSVSVLSSWLASAVEVTGGAKVELRRARAKDARSSWPIANVSPGEIIEEAIADLVVRGMRAGRFTVALVNADGGDLRKRVIEIDKDDDSGDEPGDVSDNDNPWKAIANAFARTIESQNKTIIELSKGSSVELRLALGEVTQRFAEGEGRVAEALTTVYELATLKEEKAKEERASVERREMVKSGITELAPIIGAIASHWRGTSDPAMRGLLGSITPKQQESLFAILTPEQQAALAAAIDAFKTPTKAAE